MKRQRKALIIGATLALFIGLITAIVHYVPIIWYSCGFGKISYKQNPDARYNSPICFPLNIPESAKNTVIHTEGWLDAHTLVKFQDTKQNIDDFVKNELHVELKKGIELPNGGIIGNYFDDSSDDFYDVTQIQNGKHFLNQETETIMNPDKTILNISHGTLVVIDEDAGKVFYMAW